MPKFSAKIAWKVRLSTEWNPKANGNPNKILLIAPENTVMCSWFFDKIFHFFFETNLKDILDGMMDKNKY